MDKIVSEMTSRAFVAPSSATKDDSPLSSADVRTIVIIIKINCQRDQYHQVKAKLEGQATAMMGVTLLNLGIFTLDSSSSSPSSSSSSSSLWSSGAGLYHKGQVGYGGFLGLKVLSYDFSRHLIPGGSERPVLRYQFVRAEDVKWT